MYSRSGAYHRDVTIFDQYRCVSGVIWCISIINYEFEQDTHPLAGPHNLTLHSILWMISWVILMTDIYLHRCLQIIANKIKKIKKL